MILGIVFSRDRAMQLEACLASFARHVPDASAVKVNVIYRTSSERFRRQYEELAHQHEDSVRFVAERSFRDDVMGIFGSLRPRVPPAADRSILHRWRQGGLPPVRPGTAPIDLVLFLVDDTLFVRGLSLEAVRTALQAHEDALGFSLRLGRNTTHNYVLNRQQELPNFGHAADGIVKYKWVKADGDFGYPLEISSSVYRLPEVGRIMARLSFQDPNTLESQLSLAARRFTRSQPFMLCPETSVAFSAPLNRVQDVFENRAGTGPEWSTETLAEQFDRGLRISVKALDGFLPGACHQEVELAFENRDAQ